MHRAQPPRVPRRGQHPADAPARGAPGLRDRVHHDGAFGHALEARQEQMAVAVEGDVLVDLVRDRQQIVGSAQLRDERELVAAQHLAGRVLRRVHDERPDRRVGGGGAHLAAVEPPRAGLAVLAQRHEPRNEPEDRRLRRIELVTGLHHDHAVAGLEERAERRRHAFAGPQHHRDLVLRIRAPPVEPVGAVGNGAPQLGEPERKRVLVELVARVPRPGQQLLQGQIERLVARRAARGQQVSQRHRLDLPALRLGAAEHRRDPAPHHVVHGRLVGEPLRQVHRAMLDGEPSHPTNQGLLDIHGAPPGSGCTRPGRDGPS